MRLSSVLVILGATYPDPSCPNRCRRDLHSTRNTGVNRDAGSERGSVEAELCGDQADSRWRRGCRRARCRHDAAARRQRAVRPNQPLKWATPSRTSHVSVTRAPYDCAADKPHARPRRRRLAIDDGRHDTAVVGEVNAGQGKVESSGGSDPREVESANVEHVGVVMKRGHDLVPVGRIPGDQPELGRRPVEVISRIIVAVRTASEASVVVGRE